MQFFLPQKREVETKEPSIQGSSVFIFCRGLNRLASKVCFRDFITIMYYYITELSRKKLYASHTYPYIPPPITEGLHQKLFKTTQLTVADFDLHLIQDLPHLLIRNSKFFGNLE